MTQIRDLQKGLIKMISKNGKGDKWFLKRHMNKIPKTVDSTLSKTGMNNKPNLGRWNLLSETGTSISLILPLKICFSFRVACSIEKVFLKGSNLNNHYLGN